MVNGEAVFEEPWQGRVFGMAQALVDAGVFTWDEFRVQLIAEIDGRERDAEGEYRYYEYFQRALECLLAGRGVVSAGTLAERSALLAARPSGHDHAHDHDHDHAHDHDHDHDHQQGGEWDHDPAGPHAH
jgi:nitrile hydratase accessory protein